MAGLDLLPQTRLKVACSLLAAERLVLQPAQWGDRPCALLVADEATARGREALASALASYTPVIRLAGTAPDGPRSLSLHRQATVREFVDALRAGLTDKAAAGLPGEDNQRLPPFLEHIRRDERRKDRHLLVHGLVRVVVDSMAGQVHMLRRMPLDALLELALRTDWSVSAVDDADWQAGLSADIVSTHSIESLWWRIAPGLPAELLGVEFQGLQMSQWPDMDPGAVGANWILPMACLQMREWRPMELAAASEVSLKEVRKIMAVARYSGLGGRAGPDRGSLLPGQASAPQAMSVLRIAKRFGLRLLGVVNG